MRPLLVMILMTGSLSAQTRFRAPDGYRFPIDSDFSDDWKEFRNEMPEPFVVRADFNGDGLLDEAWLLPAKAGGFGLFVFLQTSRGSPRVVRLERDPKARAQWYGVALAEPGQHKTACGKGYWACKRGEPELLDLKLPAIEFFRFESASSIFWWDPGAGRFRRTWISD